MIWSPPGYWDTIRRLHWGFKGFPCQSGRGLVVSGEAGRAGGGAGEGLGAGRQLRRGEGSAAGPGARVGGVWPPRPAPPVGVPSPLAAVLAAGLRRRAVRRAELGGGSGGRVGGGREAAPRHRAPSPGPPPTMARSEAAAAAGPGPGPPLDWVSAARSGRGGGGRGRRCERRCERASVCVSAALRRARRALARPSVCPAPACAAPCLCGHPGVCRVSSRGAVSCRACVSPGWPPLLLCVWGAVARPSEGLCAGVCAWVVCPGVSPPPHPPAASVFARLAALGVCVRVGCPSQGLCSRVCPLGCPFVRVCVCVCLRVVCLRGCVSVRPCQVPGGGWGSAPRGARPLCGFGGGEFAAPSVHVNSGGVVLGGPWGRRPCLPLPGGWVGGMGSR